jgi:hypothetical protein
MDAGYERPLDAEQVYELSDVVARALIATGAAVAEDVLEETAVMDVLETKPMRVPETKVRGRA